MARKRKQDRPGAPAKPSGRLARHRVAAYLTDAEMDRLTDAAEAAGTSRSGWIREAILAAFHGGDGADE